MRLKLSENKIRTIVNESIKKVLTEDFFDYDYYLYSAANDYNNDYDDYAKYNDDYDNYAKYNNNEINVELVDDYEVEVVDDDDTVFFAWYIELNGKKTYSPTKFNTIYEAKNDCDKMLQKLNFYKLSNAYRNQNSDNAFIINSRALIGTVDKEGKWLKTFYENYGLKWFKSVF